MFVKLSILAFNHRIVQSSSGAIRAIWVGIVMVAVFYLASIILSLKIRGPKYSTAVQVRVIRSQGIFGLISDLYIVAIPLWMVSQLTLAPKRKAGVMAVFLTGFL